MKTITQRIKESHQFFSITPCIELEVYAKACDAYADKKISSEEMQTELCKYMDASAIRSRALSAVLGRTKEPPAADIFTEATNMLVDATLRRLGEHENVSVFSEKNVKVKGGYRKPDVSIWKNNKLVGIVECKTCLGHRRNEWMKDYEKRVREFSEVGLSASKVILFVETEQTWRGFPADDPRTGDSWLVLCPQNTWHGGGKTGEVQLQTNQNEGVVKKLKNKILEMI